MRRAVQSLTFLLLFVPALSSWGEGSQFRDVVGHEFGERITVHAEMVRYLEHLAVHSPRVAIVEQGTSWERRRLLLAVVTSPENHQRLEQIQATAQRLADARQTTAEQAEGLLADQPTIVWLGGSIHGFELSGSEGALKLLERLATADDADTLAVLRDTVVLIDPMINPDGRDAFAHYNHQRIGRQPTAQRDDWANDFVSWEALQFRTGHYFFDTNRDWFAHTQLETRNRMVTLRKWRPQLIIDAHEMGADVEFYFDPPAEPYGPHFPDFARSGFEIFNSAYSKAFDQSGFEYMTGERYNYFYPGYTTSWGSYQGAVGMLYEQGSTRGLALTRADDSVRTLADALEQQYTAAWAAVATAARERQTLLGRYAESHRRAIEQGSRGTRRYLLPDYGDAGHRRELAELLQRNGIEIQVLQEDGEVSGLVDRVGAKIPAQTFAAGTWVVEAAQPRHDLIRVLMEPDLPLSETFLKEARERLDRGENPRFYDITAWSLPLLFDQQVFGSTAESIGKLEPWSSEPTASAPGPAEVPRAGYAYLLDGNNARCMAMLDSLRSEGYRAAMLVRPSRIAGQDVASGTVVVRVGQNAESVHQAVSELSQKHGVAVRSTDTGLADVGFPSLGSADVVPAKAVSVALLAEQPVHGYSFGWAWYVLDQQYGIDVTTLRTNKLAATPLHRFDTLVIPDLFSHAGLAGMIGDAGKNRLRQFVEEGGTLVAIGEAVEFVRVDLELSALRSWYDDETARLAKEGDDDAEPRHFRVPGAILRGELDSASWLSAGYSTTELPVLATSDRLYSAPKGPPAGNQRVVLRYSPDEVRLSGHLWPENLERVADRVVVYEERIGEGRVILFAEDPNFRAFWRGSDRLFLNAVLMGPGAP